MPAEANDQAFAKALIDFVAPHCLIARGGRCWVPHLVDDGPPIGDVVFNEFVARLDPDELLRKHGGDIVLAVRREVSCFFRWCVRTVTGVQSAQGGRAPSSAQPPLPATDAEVTVLPRPIDERLWVAASLLRYTANCFARSPLFLRPDGRGLHDIHDHIHSQFSLDYSDFFSASRSFIERGLSASGFLRCADRFLERTRLLLSIPMPVMQKRSFHPLHGYLHVPYLLLVQPLRLLLVKAKKWWAAHKNRGLLRRRIGGRSTQRPTCPMPVMQKRSFHPLHGYLHVPYLLVVQPLRLLLVKTKKWWAAHKNRGLLRSRTGGRSTQRPTWNERRLWEAMEAGPEAELPGLVSAGEAELREQDETDILRQRDEVSQWDVLRLVGKLDRGLLAELLVRISRATANEGFSRVVGIARDGVALAAVVAIWYQRPMSILSVSPFVQICPEPEPFDIIVLVDGARLTGGTLRCTRNQFAYFWPARSRAPDRAFVAAECVDSPFRFSSAVRSRSLFRFARGVAQTGPRAADLHTWNPREDGWKRPLEYSPSEKEVLDALCRLLAAPASRDQCLALREWLRARLAKEPFRQRTADGQRYVDRGQVWNRVAFLTGLGRYVAGAHMHELLSGRPGSRVFVIMASRYPVPFVTAAGLSVCCSRPPTAACDPDPLRFSLARSRGSWIPFVRSYLQGASKILIADTFIKEGVSLTNILDVLGRALKIFAPESGAVDISVFCLAAYGDGLKRIQSKAQELESEGLGTFTFDVLTEDPAGRIGPH